jgi:hypothetical protein
MKRSSVYSFVVVLALALAACGPGPAPTVAPSATPAPATAAPPRPFASLEGGFAVQSPVDLVETVATAETEAGNLEVHTFEGSAGEMTYVVTYVDYPESYAGNPTQQMLDAARDGQVKGEGGTLAGEGAVTVQGVLGREVRIQIPGEGEDGRVLRGYLFWGALRLYRVLVYAPAGQADSPEVSAFLDSFQFRDRPY